ncbi:MAG: tetratricopeptide repeat protein, partial [Pedosphaera parvula]|nr:tetratricopeptide repeat protein [Pedosphaera parvula]
VQVGAQSVADRYTYLPTIGILLILVWGATDYFAQRHWPPKPLTFATGLGLALCLAGTHNQLARWQNTESLFLHALQVTSNNMVAHGNLAIYYAAQGKNELATRHYQAVLQINPDQAETHNNLGLHLATLGKLDEAVSHYQTALRLKPAYAEAHNNLGVAFLRRQKLKEAAGHFTAATRLQPKLMSAQFNLGLVLSALGKPDEAATHLREAARLDPHDASVHFQLALVLWKQRQFAGARQHLEIALAEKSDWALAMERLSWLLATAPEAQVRDGRRSLALAERAKSLAGANAPEIWNALAAAYAENGSFAQAVTAGQKAVELAGQTRRTELLPEYQKRPALYQAGQPVRDPP